MSTVIRVNPTRAVDKNMVRGAVTDLVMGRKRRTAILLGLIMVAAGAIIFFYSVPLANRIASFVSDTIILQGATASISKADLGGYVQYGVWTLGGALVAYGTNKIRRG